MSLPATPPRIGSRSGFIQGGNRPSRLPNTPPWASPSLRQSEELPPVSQQGPWGNGYTNDQLLKMFTSQDDQPQPPPKRLGTSSSLFRLRPRPPIATTRGQRKT